MLIIAVIAYAADTTFMRLLTTLADSSMVYGTQFLGHFSALDSPRTKRFTICYAISTFRIESVHYFFGE